MMGFWAEITVFNDHHADPVAIVERNTVPNDPLVARPTIQAVSAFLALLICGPNRVSAAESVERSYPFEVLMHNGEIGSVKFAHGKGGIADTENGTFVISWIAYSPRGGKDVTWFINARKTRNGPLVELPEAILEQFRKTVDEDGKNSKPWKVEVTKAEETGMPVTIIHTNYGWPKRHCNEDARAEPPKVSCEDAAQILEGPIHSFRAFEFVTNWEVTAYLPTTTGV